MSSYSPNGSLLPAHLASATSIFSLLKHPCACHYRLCEVPGVPAGGEVLGG